MTSDQSLSMLFFNFMNDSRVLREAAAAKEFYPDYDVVIIAIHKEGLSEFEYTDSRLPVYRIKRTLLEEGIVNGVHLVGDVMLDLALEAQRGEG